MGSFVGKVAIVTGGGSGLGAAAAQKLAAEGASVGIADINEAHAREVADIIQAAGGKAIAIQTDVSFQADNDRLFALTQEAFGPIDVALFNAAICPPDGDLKSSTVEMFDRIIAVNLRSVFMGFKLALDRLVPGGAVVATSSTAGVVSHPNGAAYSASKYGIIGLVKSSAHLFAARGLRVNAICPGHILTPMGFAERNVTVVSSAEHRNVGFGVGILPSQIADFAAYLLGPGATALNGQAHVIDAGLTSTTGTALLAAAQPVE